jgi:hypothetical protein
MEEPVTVANALSGTVALSEAEFKALPNYSCSLPTGTIIGKRWRRREPYENGPPGTVHTWFMGEYVESDREGYVSVRWYRIQILTAREEQVRDRLRAIRDEGGCEGCGALPSHVHADYCPDYLDRLRKLMELDDALPPGRGG